MKSLEISCLLETVVLKNSKIKVKKVCYNELVHQLERVLMNNEKQQDILYKLTLYFKIFLMIRKVLRLKIINK